MPNSIPRVCFPQSVVHPPSAPNQTTVFSQLSARLLLAHLVSCLGVLLGTETVTLRSSGYLFVFRLCCRKKQLSYFSLVSFIIVDLAGNKMRGSICYRIKKGRENLVQLWLNIRLPNRIIFTYPGIYLHKGISLK